MLQEYFDYGSRRMIPRCPEQETFAGAVMESWRAEGGEPEIALNLGVWLEELELQIQSVQPLIDIVPLGALDVAISPHGGPFRALPTIRHGFRLLCKWLRNSWLQVDLHTQLPSP